MPENNDQETPDEKYTRSASGPDSNMEVIEDKVEKIQAATRPKMFGILVVVFVAVLIIMIGGLASYYYYTFQSQGSASEQGARNSWNEVVLTTMKLTDAFDQVEGFDDLVAENRNSFGETLGTVNRTLRDVLYNLQSGGSYIFAGNTFVSKLNIFLDDYIAYLRELQRLVDKGSGGVIDDISEIEKLEDLNDGMNESYDNLLIVDKNKVIQANLPRELFNMSSDIKDFVQIYLEDKQQQTDADEAERIAANEVVIKFMQAYMNRDVDAMIIYFTQEAEAEFSPVMVLEDSSEIKNSKLLDTRIMGETKIEIDAQIDKETPDSNSISENRLFVMLKRDGKWLIDSWNTT